MFKSKPKFAYGLGWAWVVKVRELFQPWVWAKSQTTLKEFWVWTLRRPGRGPSKHSNTLQSRCQNEAHKPISFKLKSQRLFKDTIVAVKPSKFQNHQLLLLLLLLSLSLWLSLTLSLAKRSKIRYKKPPQQSTLSVCVPYCFFLFIFLLYSIKNLSEFWRVGFLFFFVIFLFLYSLFISNVMDEGSMGSSHKRRALCLGPLQEQVPKRKSNRENVRIFKFLYICSSY